MPKKAKKKEEKKVERDLATVARSSLKDASATAAAPKKKKGGSGFWSTVAHALSIAADLAPLAVAMLGSGHPAVAGAMAQHGMAVVPPSPAVPAPLAVGSPLSNMVGVKSLRSSKSRGSSNVTGMHIMAVDYLVDLGDAAYSAGDLIYSAYLNPLFFDSTKGKEYASTAEQFVYRNAVLCFQSNQPATAAGRVILYHQPNPSETYEAGQGEQGVRAAASQQGATTTQVWQSACMGITPPADSSQYFFTKVAGNPLITVTQGVLNVVAGTDIVGGSSLGSLYLIYELDLRTQTAIEPDATGASYGLHGLTFNNAQTYSFLATGERAQTEDCGVNMNIMSWTQAGTARAGACLRGFAPGTWKFQSWVEGTGCTAYYWPVTDEAASYGAEIVSAAVYNNLAGSTTCALDVLFTVPEGIPPTVPILGSSLTNTTVTDLYFTAEKVDPFINTFPSIPALGAGPKWRRSMAAFAAETTDGASRKLSERVTSLEALLAHHRGLAAPSALSSFPTPVRLVSDGHASRPCRP